MSPQTVYVSKTQHYLKVKKPLLERQRRARMNKCLDSLKQLIAEFQGNDAILRMDKAEMLECALEFIKLECKSSLLQSISKEIVPPMDSFRNGYMNAVNEVSRVMAGTPGMSVNMGKAVMTHLGAEFNRLLHTKNMPKVNTQLPNSTKALLSPASSGYGSDLEDRQSLASHTTTINATATKIVWRPW